MKKIIIAAVIALLYLPAQAQETAVAKANCETTVKELGVLWHQQAAEYRALCYQAFNIAALRLDEVSKRKLRKGHYAIITDLDETILDNSYSEAQLIKEGKSYSSKSWKDWLSRSAATGIPGAVDFLKKAKAKGVSIFYISNRNTSDVNTTLINLQKLGLPDADTAHMFFSSNGSSKETRRQRVMQQYKVLLLLGDNLNDFTSNFENKNIADRFTEADNAMSDWGKKFIVLPNAIYGDWENAMYTYKFNFTPEQKATIRLQLLKGYL
jgi:5'-nucleotidase (lipoprotein e(P4) family)